MVRRLMHYFQNIEHNSGLIGGLLQNLQQHFFGHESRTARCNQYSEIVYNPKRRPVQKVISLDAGIEMLVRFYESRRIEQNEIIQWFIERSEPLENIRFDRFIRVRCKTVNFGVPAA